MSSRQLRAPIDASEETREERLTFFTKPMVCSGTRFWNLRSLLKRCGFKRSGVHILRHTFDAHFAQKGVDMAVIRDLLGHHSLTLTEKYYAHLAPSSLVSEVQRLNKKENLLPQIVTQIGFCTIFGH